MAAYTELNAPHKYVEGGLVGADTSSLGCLQVVIHRGRHLPKMDTLGKIDGYVVAHLVSPSDGRRVKTFKTKVQSRDYDPKFKKKKKISLEGWTEYPRIEFELWDRDHLSKDELGGRAVVELGKLGFSGTDPLYKQAIPIALEPKLRPSGGAAVSELVVTVGLFPDYHYTRRCLQRAGRTFYGDGAKRLLVPLANELGPGIELLVEFEGKKKQEVDVKLLQTSDAPSDAVWSDLTFMPDSDGRAIAHKIRREIFSADDVDSHLLPHGKRVSSEKKMDDLGIWTPWNRIVLRAYHYRVLVEQTQAAVHKAHVHPDVDTTQPVDFATVASQLANGAVADVPDTTVYYPIAAAADAAAQPVAWLSSTFGTKYFDRAVWRHAAADANVFVDAAYGDRRRRTEVYFAEPKLVQSVPCSMRVSVDDIKVPAYRSLFTVRVLQRLPDTIRAVNLPDVLPGVFTTYQRKQKQKDVAHLAHFQGQILPQPADGQPAAPIPDHH